MRNKKPHLFTGYITITKVFFTLNILFLIAFYFIGQWRFPDERDSFERDCKIFDAEWYHIQDNGEKVPVDIPGKVPAEFGEVVTLSTTLPEVLVEGHSLCFRVIWQDVDIYIDGELRQSYSTKESRPYGKNSALRYVFVELHEEDAGKELRYCFSSESKYAGVLRDSYIGDRMSIWLSLVDTSGVKTAVSLFLLCLALFCIIVCGILKYGYQKDLPLVYLAWAIFFCALWMISEMDFRQLVIKNVSILTNYTYWSLMMLPFPFILYMNEIQEGRYRKVYFLPIVYSTIVIIVTTVLQMTDLAQFVQMLPFIHGGTAFCILCITITITIDTFYHHNRSYLFVGIGIYGLFVSAFLEIFFYYKDYDFSLGTLLSFGLLFLLVMAMIKTGQDLFLSERKKQQAISAREAQAKFLANMSHEIRTPINAVIGMNEMILRENQNEQIQEYAHNIESASNMLLGLVNDVLDFSKIESGQLELVEQTYHTAALIQSERLIMDARIGNKPISTNIHVDPDLPTVLRGDELRIKQVINNLLSNAVKYTERGSVSLDVSAANRNDKQLSLVIRISDTGIGIQPQDIPKLFDKFKRLDLVKTRNIEGTGLGLNITKGLVELMNGTIEVESEYGKGSTFIVTLPQKIADPSPLGDFEEAIRKWHRKQDANTKPFTAPDARILVVDDNALNLKVIKGLLKRIQIQVTTATSGKECLEMTKDQTYHIILLDHMMPEMDGVETLHHLRQDASNQNQNTIVIALTANAIAGSREQYLNYGFDDYFTKPIQVPELERLLLQYLPKEFIRETDMQKK